MFETYGELVYNSWSYSLLFYDCMYFYNVNVYSDEKDNDVGSGDESGQYIHVHRIFQH